MILKSLKPPKLDNFQSLDDDNFFNRGKIGCKFKQGPYICPILPFMFAFIICGN
jgi:hypothetical protein